MVAASPSSEMLCDTAGVSQIRAHMRRIASAFGRGDFTLPGFVHAREVPGTREMRARRSAIRYTTDTVPGGAVVRLRSADSAGDRGHSRVSRISTARPSSTMTFLPSMAAIFERDLRALRREVEAYPDERDLWAQVPGVSNVAGTLVLHLAGNLQYYIGAVLGGSGYVRDRPAEFARRDVARSELLREIEAARTSRCARAR